MKIKKESVVTYLFVGVLISAALLSLYFMDIKLTGFAVYGLDNATERGGYWNKFINNGTYNLHLYNTVVNYFNGSEYIPFSYNLTPSSDPLFDYEVVESYYNVYFNEDPSAGEVVKYVKDGLEVTFQPLALNYGNSLSQIEQISMIQAVTGNPTNNIFLYGNAYGNGIDLQYTYMPTQLKEKLIINSFSDLPAPTQYIIDGGNVTVDLSFNLDTNVQHIEIDSVEWDKSSTVETSNDVLIKDDFGSIIYYFSKPYAFDSNGNFVELSYIFKKQGNNLYIVLKTPHSWLNDSSIVYPVYIDPTISISSDGGGDTYVKSGGDANKNFGSFSLLKIGSVVRSYLMFNISEIPQNQKIDNTLLCLYDTTKKIQEINVNHVYSSFDESSITWNTQPCGTDFDNFTACNLTSESSVHANSTTEFTWLCWDITNMVKEDYNSGNKNISMVLYAPDSDINSFYSKEHTNSSLWPYLNITYSHSTPIISITSPQEDENFNYNMSLPLNFTITNSTVLDTCFYNIDEGENMTISNCQNTTFNSSDGEHTLNLYVNDTLGDTGKASVNFSVYATGVSVTIYEPLGTKSSRTNIAIEFSAFGSNLTCWYNIKTSIGGDIIGNTTLENCSNSNFDVSTDGYYIFSLYVNNSVGAIDSDNSSFSVDTSPTLPPVDDSSGGGGGGGGGSSFVSSKLGLSKILDLIANPGDSKKLKLNVENKQIKFIENCRVIGAGEYSNWFSSSETKGLAGGESYEFLISLNIPETSKAGKYNLSLEIICEGASEEIFFNLEIINKKLNFDLIKVERIKQDQVKIIYSIEELSGSTQNVEVQFLLFDLSNKKIAEIKETKTVPANSKEEFETLIPIDSSLKGELNLLINLNSEIYSTFIQENIILGAPISGFTIFNEERNTDNIFSSVIILLFFVFAFFMVKRILKLRKK